MPVSATAAVAGVALMSTLPVTKVLEATVAWSVNSAPVSALDRPIDDTASVATATASRRLRAPSPGRDPGRDRDMAGLLGEGVGQTHSGTGRTAGPEAGAGRERRIAAISAAMSISRGGTKMTKWPIGEVAHSSSRPQPTGSRPQTAGCPSMIPTMFATGVRSGS